MGQITCLSKISSTLERVWSSCQGASEIWTIWRSWAHCGIKPVVQYGICTSVELDPYVVLKSNSLQHEEFQSEPSRGRLAELAYYGILNEDELLLHEAGQCPLCCQPYQ